MNKEAIINNFYKETQKYYSEETKLEPETIEEIFSNKPTFFELDERSSRIIRKLIGIYNNGIRQKIADVKKEIGNISAQRTQQIIKKSIKKIYNIDYKLKIEKAKKNKTLEISLKNSSIDNLNLNKQTTQELKSQGYKRIKDFEGITKDNIIELCKNIKYSDYKTLLEHLNTFGITFPKKIITGTIISKFDVSDDTYRYLQTHEIYTYEELKENIDSISNAYRINLNIKKELKMLHKNYLLGKTKKIIKSTEDSQTFKNLIEEKKEEEKILEELQKQKNTLYKLIDKILSSKKNVIDKSKTVNELYKLINEIDEKINKKAEIIERINIEIEEYTENIMKRIS